MSDYQKVKEFVFDQLKVIDEKYGRLNDTSIAEQITNVKKVIESGANKYIPSLGENLVLKDEDCHRMEQELDSQFNANWDASILLQGREQQEREDPTWWTGKAQQKCEPYYWNNYKNCLNELPSKAVKAIANDTDMIMNNIENPNVGIFDRRGMVVGHVQSGKTGNYAGLICKAADAGYKFIIVISGTNINNLRDQTQKRLDNSFVGIHRGERSGGGKYEPLQGYKQPISLTSADKDFKKQDAVRNAGVLNLDNTTAPIFLVIKKNVTSLKNVIDWLNSLNKNSIIQHAMLMIDDEADYASINYKDDDSPTRINERLRELLALFKRSSYVGYTATPYANVFINHKAGNEKLGDDLFPRDFIYALGAPDNYFGARTVFLDEDRQYLVPVPVDKDEDDYENDIPAKHKKDFELPTIPKSLYEAMRVFLLNIAIRDLRGQGDKHNSMLVHATRFTFVHQKLASHIEEYVNKIKNDIVVYGKLTNANQQSSLIQDLEQTLNTTHQRLEFTWREILGCLCEKIDSVVIREVHQRRILPLEYRKDITTNAIVVGGASLSRGFTLEGLSVSYFLRNTVFYDTLMQMGRWFGYREGYQDLCRIYMPKIMIGNFGHIIEATEDLIDDFKKMQDEGMTPKDFGLAVKHHPDSLLQVTARNKQRTTQDIYFDMKLDGHSKETSCLYSDVKIKLNNIQSIKNIVSAVSKTTEFERKGTKYLWRDIDKAVVKNFLNEFKVISLDPFGLKTRMPIDFIKKYVEEQSIDWDIALYSGDGGGCHISNEVYISKETRKIIERDSYYELQNRQVSSGSAESIVLSDEQQKRLGSKRKEIRAIIPKPLLMLHILQTKTEQGMVVDEELAAFGISFPGGVKSTGKTVKLKINSVYIDEILEGEQSDD